MIGLARIREHVMGLDDMKPGAFQSGKHFRHMNHSKVVTRSSRCYSLLLLSWFLVMQLFESPALLGINAMVDSRSTDRNEDIDREKWQSWYVFHLFLIYLDPPD